MVSEGLSEGDTQAQIRRQPSEDAGMGSFQGEGGSECKGLGAERRPVHLRTRRKGDDWSMVSDGKDALGRG